MPGSVAVVEGKRGLTGVRISMAGRNAYVMAKTGPAAALGPFTASFRWER